MTIHRTRNMVTLLNAPNFIGVEWQRDKCSGSRFTDDGFESLSSHGEVEYLTLKLVNGCLGAEKTWSQKNALLRPLQAFLGSVAHKTK